MTNITINDYLYMNTLNYGKVNLLKCLETSHRKKVVLGNVYRPPRDINENYRTL